ncbi:hypothetical protein O181_018968 [Austropuccinia psidii MF-1]|uniref:Reverse transcriptase Ty1/copia-type domain-containing protein n=1 Tax=Austropuccinia psidii MF-1 TaxID=1389203 RepID=A0A9Q3C8T4_9BASI|nr:hypothetical protein [Austropuccinia psidii MF-1]
MEDLGKAKYALGIRIVQETDCISLLQDKFINQIPEEFNLTNAKPMTAPLLGNIKYLRNPMEEQPPKVPFNYWWAIETPRSSHFKAVEHVFQYLIGTRSFTLKLGLNLLKNQETNILGFSDADWGGTKEYKSFSGSLIYYFGTISWRSHKQKVVALSSAEAEYNALTECSQDLQWTRPLIYETTQVQCRSILHSDNQSAIPIASNHIYHHGTRHINF